jgi:hypothetical protein
MIRHAPRPQAQAISTLSIAVIKTAFFRLLMAAIGLAMFYKASYLTASRAAINLSSITLRADEEDHATIRRLTKALPERIVTLLLHI